MEIHNEEDYLLIKKEYPRIGNILELFWGLEEFNTYIIRLMNDTRDGNRQGFSKEVGWAIFRLSQRHDYLYPKLIKPEGLWKC